MVKKVKRIIVFMLFSLFFNMLSNKTETGSSKAKLAWSVVPSAEAKCCPAGSDHLDNNGNCCKPEQTNMDSEGNCY